MPEPIYSPGLEGIIAGETAVSSIAGELRYRGYAVEALADRGTFEETAYLLLHGELPRREELAAFRERLAAAGALPPPLIDALRSIPAAVPTMDVMRSAASLLAHWDAEAADNGHDANVRKAERLLAQLPVAMAVRQRLREGKPPIPPDPRRSLAGNVLWMLGKAEVSPRWERAMDASLVMYAEHEFNASTFTARVCAATLSDLHSCVTAAIGALKGPLHGGANERVMDVLEEVGSSDKAEAWIRKALAEKRLIMGFGHRVYKTGDPRAAYLKPLCQQLAAETGNGELEAIAEKIERIVVAEKRLPANLDWPSARLYHYLGIPVDLFTPLFVVSRVAGWSAHVIEQLDNNRIIRPLARYTGPADRAWKELAAR